MPRVPRNLANPEDFYRNGSPKKAQMMRLSQELKSEIKQRAFQLSKKVRDPAKGDPDPKTSTKKKSKSYRQLSCPLPEETHAWLTAMAIEKNCTLGVVIIALVTCASKGAVFSMERLWTKAERRFYAAELRKQKRLQQLQIDRQGKKTSSNDRHGSQHFLNPEELELQEEARARHRGDGS